MVADFSRAQRRVEGIITALGQLASGQLAEAEDREVIDVTNIVDRVARENMPGRAVDIDIDAADDLGTVMGWPGALRRRWTNRCAMRLPTGGPAGPRSPRTAAPG